MSRRGTPNNLDSDSPLAAVTWVACDALQPGGALESIIELHGPFDAVVHCIGALFDGASGLRRLNTLVSAVGSLPAEGSSYEEITTSTALTALSAIEAKSNGSTFVFVSAAEAEWLSSAQSYP